MMGKDLGFLAIFLPSFLLWLRLVALLVVTKPQGTTHGVRMGRRREGCRARGVAGEKSAFG